MGRRRALRFRAAVLGALAGASAAKVAAAGDARVTVEGARFLVRLADGGSLAGDALVGLVLETVDARGAPVAVRIDGWGDFILD